MSLATIVAIASGVTALRLITYHRGTSEYCFFKSLIAYVLIVISGAQAIHILINHAQVTLLQTLATIVMMSLLLRSKGNVGCIFRRGN